MPLGDGGPLVAYREVTVWHGAKGEFGKTLHRFQTSGDQGHSGSNWFPFFQPTSHAWKRGQEIEATEFSAAGQAQHRVRSTYAFRDDGPSPDTMTTRSLRGISINFFDDGDPFATAPTYVFSNYQVFSAWTYLSGDTTTVYDTTGTSSFSTVRSYAYGNPAHVQPTELTETNSDGTQRITRMTYPADYAVGAGNVEAIALSAMQGSAHIHSPVIERSVTKRAAGTDSVVQGELTSFKSYPAGYLPYQRFVLNSPGPITNFAPSSVVGGVFAKDSRYLLQESAVQYDAYGRIGHLEDARGKFTDFYYGGNANNAFLTRVTRLEDGWGWLDLNTVIGYDSDGFVSSIADEGGSVRSFTYDLFGRLRQIRNHGGTVVKAFGYTYSRTGPGWTFNPSTPNAITDTTFIQHAPTAKSVVTTQYLDGLGRPIQEVQRDGSSYVVSTSQYDAMGRPWRSWKPYTRSSADYDANFAASATSFYNTYLGTSTAKPYVETLYRADALTRPAKIIPEFLGASPSVWVLHEFGIDAASGQQITQITDESGKKTRRFADIFGNEVKTILGAGALEATTALAAFDVLGQRRRMTDPRNLVTTYAVDTRGLLTSRSNPDAGAVSIKHDRAGNPRYTQDAKQAAAGQVHFTDYDFANRPLVSGVGTGSFAAIDPEWFRPPIETTEANWLAVRAYDLKPMTTAFPWNLFSAEISPLTLANLSGRLSAVASKSNGAWQVSLFSYDADGRVATRYTFTQANGGGSVLTALNKNVNYVRDLRDAVTERWVTVGSTPFTHWYEFNDRGLLWKIFSSAGSTKPATPDVTYTYRPSGQLQDRQFAGGPVVPLRYGIREQLEKIGDPATTSYPFSARYAYHPNGALSEAEFYNAGSPAAQKRYKYAFGAASYDALTRLKSADFSSWSGSAWTSTLAHDLAGITYDVAGNLTALRRYRETGTLVDNLTYAYPSSSNRLSSVSDAVGATAESWDAETGAFTYDANGNLTTAPAPYSVTAVSYDHQNLALSLTRSGTTTSYRYDDAGQRIAKQVGTGNTEIYVLEGASTLGVFSVNGSGTLTAWHMNVLAGERVIGRQPDVGSRRYYHTDLLGSTRSAVTGTTVVESHDYEPWGLRMPGRTLGSGTREGFTGKERDAESGLDYFGARYYMPALGRWTGVDPLAEKHPEWSPYNYVLNNPLMLIDPDGRQVRANANRMQFAAGVASGAWSGVKGTVGGMANAVAHPVETVQGVAALATPEGRHAAGIALAEALQERVAKVQSGDPHAQGQVAGEALAVVFEMVAGAKGAGMISKATRGANAASDVARVGSRMDDVTRVVAKPVVSVSLRRPYIRVAVRREVERRATRTSDGRFFVDPNTGRPITRKYDLGHKFRHEFWREKAKAEREGLTQAEFNDRMNDPDLYQIEDPSSNRSRRYENPPS